MIRAQEDTKNQAPEKPVALIETKEEKIKKSDSLVMPLPR